MAVLLRFMAVLLQGHQIGDQVVDVVIRVFCEKIDMRFRWVCVRLDTIDVDELRDLLVEAWRMVVPKKVAAAYDE